MHIRHEKDNLGQFLEEKAQKCAGRGRASGKRRCVEMGIIMVVPLLVDEEIIAFLSPEEGRETRGVALTIWAGVFEKSRDDGQPK